MKPQDCWLRYDMYVLMRVHPFASSACDTPADFAFILDGSGSIRDMNPADGSYDNWVLLLKFVANIVKHFSESHDNNRFAVVVFSNKGSMVFGLNKYDDTQSLVDAILSVDYPGANTNTSGGIFVARSQVFNIQNGDRPDIQNIAIIVTDGKSTFDSQKTIPYAQELQKDGVQVFSVGITKEVDEAELRGMSSQPQARNQNYFTSADFQSMGSVLDGLLAQACALSPPTTPKPCKFLLV